MFHKNCRRPDGLQVRCKECAIEARVAYYHKNKERESKRNKQHYKAFKEWYRSLKKGPCTDCKVEYPPSVMTWDHLPGYKKVGNLGDLVQRGNRQLILDEIEKCDLVCLNCHALRTTSRLEGSA